MKSDWEKCADQLAHALVQGTESRAVERYPETGINQANAEHALASYQTLKSASGGTKTEILISDRPLKFRVWDKLAKHMIYPDNGYQGHYTLSLNGDFHNLQNGAGGKETAVSQFTGRTDKVGRDIYEGDLVESPQGSVKVVRFTHGRYEPDLTNSHELCIVSNVFEEQDS